MGGSAIQKNFIFCMFFDQMTWFWNDIKIEVPELFIWVSGFLEKASLLFAFAKVKKKYSEFYLKKYIIVINIMQSDLYKLYS